MKEGDYLARISSSVLPHSEYSTVQRYPFERSAPSSSRDELESYIARAGLPISPICYVGLCIVTAFFVFLQVIAFGPVTAVSAGLIVCYITIVFMPIELFARRMRKAEYEIPGVIQLLGEQLQRGHSLDQAIASSLKKVKSDELYEVMQSAQQRLLLSGALNGLGDAKTFRGFGAVFAGLVAVLNYAARYPAHESGIVCCEFSQHLKRNTQALRTHTIGLCLIRTVGLGAVAVMLAAAASTGCWSADVTADSSQFFARDLGAVVLLLSVVAILRITSLAEWERYGKK